MQGATGPANDVQIVLEPILKDQTGLLAFIHANTDVDMAFAHGGAHLAVDGVLYDEHCLRPLSPRRASLHS
jgi:hypothetical protein